MFEGKKTLVFGGALSTMIEMGALGAVPATVSVARLWRMYEPLVTVVLFHSAIQP